MVGIPLALGSYWGLLLVIPGVILLVVRIIDEEKMLERIMREIVACEERLFFMRLGFGARCAAG